MYVCDAVRSVGWCGNRPAGREQKRRVSVAHLAERKWDVRWRDQHQVYWASVCHQDVTSDTVEAAPRREQQAVTSADSTHLEAHQVQHLELCLRESRERASPGPAVLSIQLPKAHSLSHEHVWFKWPWRL